MDGGGLLRRDFDSVATAGDFLIPVVCAEGIDAGPEGDGGLAGGAEDETARGVEVFLVIHAALGFDGIGVAVPPIGAGVKGAGVGGHREFVCIELE